MVPLNKTGKIVLIFLAVAFIFFAYSDRIVDYIARQDSFVILALSYLLSPMFILFVYLLYKHYGINGVFGGVLFSLASDLISLPHIITTSGELSQSTIKIILDNLIYEMLPESLKSMTIGSVNLAVFVMYVVFSTSLVILAFMVSNKKSGRQIFYKSI